LVAFEPAFGRHEVRSKDTPAIIADVTNQAAGLSFLQEKLLGEKMVVLSLNPPMLLNSGHPAEIGRGFAV